MIGESKIEELLSDVQEKDDKLDVSFSDVDKTVVKPMPDVPACPKERWVDYSKITAKSLRGQPADPDRGIQVRIYSERLQKTRIQILKRYKLIDLLVIYNDINGMRHIGKCVAFDLETGSPVIISKDGIAPDSDNPALTFVMKV